METSAIIYLVIAIVNFLLLLVGGGVAYGKLVQKNNTTDADVNALKDDVKALRVWGESELDKAVADRNANFLRKDVFAAQHSELCAQVRELLDLKLPAFMAKLEVSQTHLATNQTQLSVDMAKLQLAVEKISEKIMEMK
jgi:hypothetical protein